MTLLFWILLLLFLVNVLHLYFLYSHDQELSELRNSLNSANISLNINKGHTERNSCDLNQVYSDISDIKKRLEALEDKDSTFSFLEEEK